MRVHPHAKGWGLGAPNALEGGPLGAPLALRGAPLGTPVVVVGVLDKEGEALGREVENLFEVTVKVPRPDEETREMVRDT